MQRIQTLHCLFVLVSAVAGEIKFFGEMLSTSLTSNIGKLFANVMRELIRCDSIIGRDTLVKAGSIKKCTNDNNFDGSSLSWPAGGGATVITTTTFIAPTAASVASSTNSQANPRKLAEEQETRRLSDGKFGTSKPPPPPPSFKLAKVWTSFDGGKSLLLNRQFEPERSCINDFCRKNKSILCIVDSTQKSFLRNLHMLVKPIGLKESVIIKAIKEQTATNLITKRGKVKINYRNDCAEWCGENPCNLNRPATKLGKSMWLTPECKPPACLKDRPYRYDIEYMPGSNKETREYQQTWIECPPIKIVKTVCCYEPKCYPPICRRPRKCPQNVPEKYKTCGVNTCKIEPPCPKIMLPCCCEKARDPPCCKVYPTPSCCQKRCTPYPAFSECCRPDFNRKGPVECFCLIRPTMCEVWADWRKKHLPGGTEY